MKRHFQISLAMPCQNFCTYDWYVLFVGTWHNFGPFHFFSVPPPYGRHPCLKRIPWNYLWMTPILKIKKSMEKPIDDIHNIFCFPWKNLLMASVISFFREILPNLWMAMVLQSFSMEMHMEDINIDMFFHGILGPFLRQFRLEFQCLS